MIMKRHEDCRAGCKANLPVCERGVCVYTFAAATPAIDPAEAIRQRRLGKPRVPLGVKPPPGEG